MKSNRILARRVARTLSEEELQQVTGGATAPGTGLLYNTGGGITPPVNYDYKGEYGSVHWTQTALGHVD